MSDIVIEQPIDLSKMCIFTSISLICAVLVSSRISEKVHSVLVFVWACFVKPIFNKVFNKTTEQQHSLELFYKNQAHVYDKTRKLLLKGRKECLRLATAHLSKKRGLVWVDIRGGSGSNIEYMDQVMSISKNFNVYLIVVRSCEKTVYW